VRPSDGQHTVGSLRRPTIPESSDGLRTTLLVSINCPGRLSHGPCVSCHEKALCFEYFEDLVPEGTLPEEKVSVLPCCVATGAASMNTCLEVRP